ncbi:TetR family transcriptional regulator C-terminal domain-containing protein [Actinomadura sp. 6K520]|uniref:TetR/AcrR family transcriptional regulator n=1 Tax=Actinomadura sp. 6K520 TaxID=2530364 RepID=UPI00104E87B2|nr:TetR family transcriptional regulator C-terminal domain-containing protein [Actinomadura sp. 6K520]TDE33768.1 TetR family transcriptional regulator [Actinomadura sp. 6K520]
MPRIADHEQRRRQIAAAVCDLIAEDGFDRVTVARTAAAAGISVGLVQHYFRTKDEMLLHAFTHVSASIRGRIDERIQAGAEHRRPISQVLAEALAEFLPLDGERRAEFRVVKAFEGRALDVPALAEVDIATARTLLDELVQAVHNGKECGEVEPSLEPRPAAVRLAAVTDGLAMQAHRDPAELAAIAPAIIKTELATVFTGECRQYAGKRRS